MRPNKPPNSFSAPAPAAYTGQISQHGYSAAWNQQGQQQQQQYAQQQPLYTAHPWPHHPSQHTQYQQAFTWQQQQHAPPMPRFAPQLPARQQQQVGHAQPQSRSAAVPATQPPGSDKKTRRGKRRTGATAAASGASAEPPRMPDAVPLGSKRSRSAQPQHASAAGQQQSKRQRVDAVDTQQDISSQQLSLVDLCLRKARLRHSNSSGTFKALLTLPQLQAQVNAEAKAKSIPQSSLVELKQALEAYLLAVCVPTAQQQQQNQRQATQQAHLAVQGSSRVVQASVVLNAEPDSDNKPQMVAQRPGIPDTAAGKDPAPEPQKAAAGGHPQQHTAEQVGILPNFMLTDHGTSIAKHRVAFEDKLPAAASLAPAAAAAEASQASQQPKQHIRFESDSDHSSDVEGEAARKPADIGLNLAAAAVKQAKALDSMAAGAHQEQPQSYMQSHQEGVVRARHIRFTDSGIPIPSPYGRPPSRLPPAAAVPLALYVDQQPPQLQPERQQHSTSKGEIISELKGCQVDAVTYDSSLMLPVVWSAEALDSVISSYVNSRSLCTLMDVRQQLLVMHGLTVSVEEPDGGLLMTLEGLMKSAAVQRYFPQSSKLGCVPPLNSRHVVQAAVLALFCKWLDTSRQQAVDGGQVSHSSLSDVRLSVEELNKELSFGNTAAANTLSWSSSIRLLDLSMLSQLTAQHLKAAMTQAETAVLQQLTSSQQSGNTQHQLDTQQRQLAADSTPAAVGEPVASVLQQASSLSGVCAQLQLEVTSYQPLLEEAAILAETLLRNAGHWSEWICMKNFATSLQGLVRTHPALAANNSSHQDSGNPDDTVVVCVMLQLLQHILYFAINGRIAELYHNKVSPALTAVRQLHSDKVVGVSQSAAGSTDPLQQLVAVLQQLKSAFMGLFPAGKQYGAEEVQQLKDNLRQLLATPHQQQQQQHRDGVAAAAADPDSLSPESISAAAAEVAKVLLLVHRLLAPPPAPAAAVTSSEDDSDAPSDQDESNSSGNDGGPKGEHDGDIGPQAATGQNQQEADSRQQRQRRRVVSDDDLHQALTEFADGFSLSNLASLEHQLVKRFGVDSFSKLGLGADSLLQLLQQQPHLLAILTTQEGAQPCDVGARVELRHVLQLVRQAKSCCAGMGAEDASAAVARCLCKTFGVRNVQQLGHGSIDRLLAMSSTTGAEAVALDTLGRNSCVWNVCALAAPAQLSPCSMMNLEDSIISKRQAAVDCLQCAPLMTDLHSWSQWHQVFEPSLGSLDDFIAEEGPSSGLLVLAVPPAAAAGGLISVRQHGQLLLKLDPSATREQMQAAAAKGHAVHVVGSALSLLVQSGGVALAPLSLMADSIQSGLQQLMAKHGFMSTSRAGQQPSSAVQHLPPHDAAAAAATLILQCLKLLPAPLRAPLGHQLLLQPLYSLLGGATATQQLLLELANAAAAEAAAVEGFVTARNGSGSSDSSSIQRSAVGTGVGGVYSADLATLHSLGWDLGVAVWQHDWRNRCCRSTSDRTAAAAGADAECGGGALSTVTIGPHSIITAAGAALTPSAADGLQQMLTQIQQPEQSTANQSITPQTSPHTTAAAAETSPQQQQLIDQIRQQEFGLGVTLSPDAEALMIRQRQRMGRALARLSKELYSSNTHFVLELVQNADDNLYGPDVVPALEFILLPGAVAAFNNESGFAERDVRALCDVGASTKTELSGSGHIGYKGIGFKSVFKVCDAPELHSAGYHIKFDLQQDPALGYILPSWMDEEECLPAGSAAAHSRLGLPFNSSTAIYLPLRKQAVAVQPHQQSMTGLLRQGFQDIKPTLLLFLAKLHCICVTDLLQPSHSRVMMKRQIGDHIVELRHGDKAQHAEHWMVVRSTISLPAAWHARHQHNSTASEYKQSADHDNTTSSTSNSGLRQTQLAVAFCLTNPKQPQQQPVFAFLPLRSYGLRFVLQADWQVPSSREAVDADSPWNQALRDQVPAMLLAAMHVFMDLSAVVAAAKGDEYDAAAGGQLTLPAAKPQQQQQQGLDLGVGALPRLSRECWLDCWLRCLPVEGQAQGFFAALPVSVAAHLRDQPCIPTESGRLAAPTDVLICSNPAVRQLISHDQLEQLLGKQFVHSEVTALHTNAELRSLLGVGEFSPLEVVRLIEQMAAAGGLQQQGVPWVQKVLLCLFGMMEVGSSSSSTTAVTAAAAAAAAAGGPWSDQARHFGRLRVLQKLRKLEILPLQTGAYVAIDSRAGVQGTTSQYYTDRQLEARTAAAGSSPVFFPLQDVAVAETTAATAAAAGPLSPVRQLSPMPSSRSPSITAAAAAAAGGGGVDVDLLHLLASAGVQLDWLDGLQLLSRDLFTGLRSDDLELMKSGLQALGVRDAQPVDVLQLSLLPAMSAAAALDWSPERLVAYLAFPLIAGLLQLTTATAAATTTATAAAMNTVTATPAVTAATPVVASTAAAAAVMPKTVARGAVMTAFKQQGLRHQQQQQEALLAALRSCVVVNTTQGNVRLSDTETGGGAAAAAADDDDDVSCRQSGVSYSVYLPPSWTWHNTDWQQQFPQMRWKVISPLYSQLHPDLDQEWSVLFMQLGVRSLPPLIARTISSRQLQQQQDRLQQRQQQLCQKFKLQHEQDLRCQGQASQQQQAGVVATAGAAAAAVPQVPHPLECISADVSMETASASDDDSDAVDMDTGSDEQQYGTLQPELQRQQQQATSGKHDATNKAAAVDTLHAVPAVDFTATGGGSSGHDAAADTLLQDWLCPDLQLLLSVVEQSLMSAHGVNAVGEKHEVLCRLLKLLDQHWDSYEQHIYTESASAAAPINSITPVAGTFTAGGGLLRTAAATQQYQSVVSAAPGITAEPSTPVPLLTVWQPAAPHAASHSTRAPRPSAAGAGSKDSHSTGSPADSGSRQLTTFGQLLRYALLPCVYRGGIAISSSLTSDQHRLRLLPGQQMYAGSESMLSLFKGFKLPYLAVDVQHQQLLDLLQVQHQLSVDLVLSLLEAQVAACEEESQIKWSSTQLAAAAASSATTSQQPGDQLLFVSSCQLMAKLYLYLQQQLETAAAAQSTALVDQQAINQTAAPEEAILPLTSETAASRTVTSLHQRVLSSFQQHPLVWLPLTLSEPCSSQAGSAATSAAKNRQQLDSGDSRICTGGFHRLDELCVTDPSGVLGALCIKQQKEPAKISNSSSLSQGITSQRRTHSSVCSVPRPLLLHYPSLQRMFADWMAAGVAKGDAESASAAAGSLIASEPSIEQYTAALQLLATEAAGQDGKGTDAGLREKDVKIWSQVLSITDVLSQRLENNQISRAQLTHMQQALQGCQWLWCYNLQQWVSLNQEPYVADDAKLSAVMAAVPGVCLVQLQGSTTHASAVLGSVSQQCVLRLLSLLGVVPLSESVTADLHYEEMSDWHEMSQNIADALLLAQRWCWCNKTRTEYDAIAERLLPKLDFLTVVAVRNLTVSYSVVVEDGETAVSQPVSAAVLQHDMQLLVAPDQSDLYLQLAEQLARLISDDIADLAPLTDLLLSVLHAISSGSSAELLMNVRGIPPLPQDVLSGGDSGGDQQLAGDMQQQPGTSSSAAAGGSSSRQVKLWQLYVPAAPALFDDVDSAGLADIDDAAAAEGDWDDAGSLASAEADDDGDGSDDYIALWAGDGQNGDHQSEAAEDEDEDELSELQEVTPDEITAESAAQAAAQAGGAGLSDARKQLKQQAGSAAVVSTQAGTAAAQQTGINLAVAGTAAVPIIPLHSIRSPATAHKTVSLILLIYNTARAAAQSYLAHAAPAGDESSVALSSEEPASDTVEKEPAAAATAATVQAGASNRASVSREPSPAAEQVATDQAAKEAPTSRAGTPGEGAVQTTAERQAAAAAAVAAKAHSCGPKHLVDTAAAVFDKMLDSKTLTALPPFKVLAAAGGAAAALAKAAGMRYGCREHVAFLRKLLPITWANKLGKRMEWKGRYMQLATDPVVKALAYSAIRLVNVTSLQPCVMWETAADVRAEPKKATGRWGEQLVAIYLSLQLGQTAQVVWVNDKQETGLPYDIKIIHNDSRTEYVEVKTTSTQQLQQFYISLRELETAAKYGRAFTVVRVFGCPAPVTRPQEVEEGVALAPGYLKASYLKGAKQAPAAKGPKKGKPGQPPPVDPAQQQTKLLFLQDPVQLLRRQLVRLLLEV